MIFTCYFLSRQAWESSFFIKEGIQKSKAATECKNLVYFVWHVPDGYHKKPTIFATLVQVFIDTKVLGCFKLTIFSTFIAWVFTNKKNLALLETNIESFQHSSRFLQIGKPCAARNQQLMKGTGHHKENINTCKPWAIGGGEIFCLLLKSGGLLT